MRTPGRSASLRHADRMQGKKHSARADGMRFFCRAFLPGLALLLFLNGCGGREEPKTHIPSVALATEGPPLVLVGEYGGMRLEGYMDRGCMAGHGSLALRAIGLSQKENLSVKVPALPAPPPEKEKKTAERKQTRSAPVVLQALEPYMDKNTPEMTTGNAPADAATGRARPAASGIAGKKGKNELALGSYLGIDSPAAEAPSAQRRETSSPPAALRGMKTQGSGTAEPVASVDLGLKPEFVCKAVVDALPSDKGRIRGLLECTGNRKILFSLRNLGPDQGVGIGKETEDHSLMILFYHSSPEEAWRRFPAVKEDIRAARERQ